MEKYIEHFRFITFDIVEVGSLEDLIQCVPSFDVHLQQNQSTKALSAVGFLSGKLRRVKEEFSVDLQLITKTFIHPTSYRYRLRSKLSLDDDRNNKGLG